MNQKKHTTGVILFTAAVFFIVTALAQSCVEDGKKRCHLDHFTRVDDISILSGGDQLTFTGCGHKDFSECTIYRYDRKENILYRYVHENKLMQVMGAQYWSDSKQFLFITVPKTQDRKQLIEDMQIVIMNPDGTGFKQLTEGKGVKAAMMLSPDGKTLVYASGRERTEGKTIASHFDFYARDVPTGKETQMTNLAFYEISTPYFTPDGKNVVFDYGSPMRIPTINDTDAVQNFRETYKEKYKGNFIIQYPVDGTGIGRLPEPLFTFGLGSEDSIMTKDGSIWFEGRAPGIQYYRRYPDGKIIKFTYEQLGISKTRDLFRMAVDRTGQFMAILYEDLDRNRTRSVAIFDTSTKNRIPISVPATATNISIH